MKIVINTENTELYNAFYRLAKDSEHQLINAKVESVLFDNIEKNDVDAYILSNNTFYFKKAVDFIKKSNPYIPIIAIMPDNIVLPNVQVDVCMNINTPFESFTNAVYFNIRAYIKTFETLQKLTAKAQDKIEFANCIYDPTRRILYHRVKLSQTQEEKDQHKEPTFIIKKVKELSPKEGGILEILALNYGEVVKKEVILEKVWRKTDYFTGRSMDVYISYLRSALRDNKIKLTIKNVSGIGLILE